MQRVQTLIVRPFKMSVRNMQNTASVPKTLYTPKDINLEKPKPIVSWLMTGGAFTGLAGYAITR
jgi:predicted peptidase